MGRWVGAALIAVLLACNVALLISQRVLSETLRSFAGEDWKQGLEALRGELDRLKVERVRVEDQLSRARGLVSRLEEALAARAGSENEEGGAAAEEVDAPPEDPLARVTIEFGPRPSWLEPIEEIPRLEPEYVEDLRRRRDAIRDIPGDGPLLSGNLEALLSDPRWNPQGQELSSEEREELARLMAEYRYFARDAAFERLEKYMKPELARLRAEGAYIEYDMKEGPPSLERVRVSYAESSGRPGVMRLFVFPEADYPEIARQEAVARERALETFVLAYELINGSAADATSR